MSKVLSQYGRMLLQGDEGLGGLSSPVIIWEDPSPQTETLLLTTGAGQPHSRPRAGEPLVFEVVKGDQRQNAFAFGVTVGRTANNDILLDDPSVSRFHAYFQKDAKTGAWKVVDAESRNGTQVNGAKLAPNSGVELANGARVRFGDVLVTFFFPGGFVQHLKQLIA